MLVFADAERLEDPAALRDAVASALEAIHALEPGRPRHEALVAAFTGLGELVQGLADAEFDAHGCDDGSAVEQTGAHILLELAQAIARSWDSSFAGAPALPTGWRDELERLRATGPLRVRRPEGYAYYALYPEGYLEAARRSGLGPDTTVIGIRSIGTGLAAMVAAGLDAAPATTLRPTGHPFSRQIVIGPALAEQLLAAPATIALVDEGPSLSGSSFGAIADWLEERGIAPGRLHFFPGHRNALGPMASARHRRRWSQRPRHVVGFEEQLLHAVAPAHRLESWVADLLGPLDGPLLDISGGAWRQRLGHESRWPPGFVRLERRKFLARTGGDAWLVKFAGIGAGGQASLRKGRLLAAAGHTPEIAGICHGFLVQRWVPGRSPTADDHRDLVAAVGRYLAYRADRLPAAVPGAAPVELADMALYNAGTALGADAAARLRPHLAGAEQLATVVVPVDTDNRLHAWEWLRTSDGRLLKTDALDHSAAHDLVGCQDIAWDIAGAAVELSLTPAERDEIAAAVAARTDRPVVPELLDFMEICYCGFQLGLWNFAAAEAGGVEADRIAACLQRYRGRLDRPAAVRPPPPAPASMRTPSRRDQSATSSATP